MEKIIVITLAVLGAVFCGYLWGYESAVYDLVRKLKGE